MKLLCAVRTPCLSNPADDGRLPECPISVSAVVSVHSAVRLFRQVTQGLQDNCFEVN